MRVVAHEGRPRPGILQQLHQVNLAEHLDAVVCEMLREDGLQSLVSTLFLRHRLPRWFSTFHHSRSRVFQVPQQALQVAFPPRRVVEHDGGHVDSSAQVPERLLAVGPRPALHALRVNGLQQGVGDLPRGSELRLRRRGRHRPRHAPVLHLQILQEAANLGMPLLQRLQLHDAPVQALGRPPDLDRAGGARAPTRGGERRGLVQHRIEHRAFACPRRPEDHDPAIHRFLQPLARTLELLAVAPQKRCRRRISRIAFTLNLGDSKHLL
mmetsp:Transcript_28765/g.95565  ORF Transcript_28765/g.95565 Transcript_28765/m.95565 type:complete len:267 (+) Transcript_28765:2301-3101(+)